jgi:predicted GH43/DUF377 family glycosyl hydrolase
MVVGVGMAAAQTDWVQYEGNPVIPPAEDGSWDDGRRFVDCVIEVDGTYHLYYHGQAEGLPILNYYDIGHATSSDGITWELDPANPVLTRGAAGEWDSDEAYKPAVIHDGSEFRMWFGGGDGVKGRVGYATSPDGSAWTKHDGNPIMDVGPDGSFDDLGLWPGEVIVDGGLYRMWYTGQRDAGAGEYDWRIGYAESEDGLSWTRNPDPVLGPGPGWDDWLLYFPTVYFDGLTYHMWYSAHTGSYLAIGYAVSADGLRWTRYLGNPVLGGPGNDTETGSVLYDETVGQFSLWFRDREGEGVSLATSECCSLLFVSFVPAAAYGAGAEGSFYVTDLDLSNAGEVQAEYRFSWLPRGEDNSDWISSETFTLGAGQSVRYMNVLSEVFGLEPDAYGAVMVESSVDRLLVMARVYNRPGDGSSGTFGQSMPAISVDDFMVAGDRRRILFGTENDEMRTNIGCQNFKDSSALINLELLAADGTSLETKTMLLRSWSNDQLNRVFHDDMPMTGAVDVWTDVPSGFFYCYGSVLDNVTSDPTTIPPQ